MTSQFTKERLDAKAVGNKTMADVYKIVINSVYGKLAEDARAFLRDQRKMLRHQGRLLPAHSADF